MLAATGFPRRQEGCDAIAAGTVPNRGAAVTADVRHALRKGTSPTALRRPPGEPGIREFASKVRPAGEPLAPAHCDTHGAGVHRDVAVGVVGRVRRGSDARAAGRAGLRKCHEFETQPG
jgi:hypothetical protein